MRIRTCYRSVAFAHMGSPPALSIMSEYRLRTLDRKKRSAKTLDRGNVPTGRLAIASIADWNSFSPSATTRSSREISVCSSFNPPALAVARTGVPSAIASNAAFGTPSQRDRLDHTRHALQGLFNAKRYKEFGHSRSNVAFESHGNPPPTISATDRNLWGPHR